MLGAQRYATVVLDANGEATIPLSFGPADVGRDITFQAFFRDTADARTEHVQRSAAGRDPVTSTVSAPDPASGSVFTRRAPHGARGVSMSPPAPPSPIMRLLPKILAISAIGAALLIAGATSSSPGRSNRAADGSRAAFGVPSTIGGVGASPGVSTTSIGFTDYRLEAPSGFREPVLSIARFDLGVETPSLLDDTKEITHFVLEDLVLTLEQDGLKTNLVPLIEHVSAAPG